MMKQEFVELVDDTGPMDLEDSEEEDNPKLIKPKSRKIRLVKPNKVGIFLENLIFVFFAINAFCHSYGLKFEIFKQIFRRNPVFCMTSTPAR